MKKILIGILVICVIAIVLFVAIIITNKNFFSNNINQEHDFSKNTFDEAKILNDNIDDKKYNIYYQNNDIIIVL